MKELRPVKIRNVAVYDGKCGWFHGFGVRSRASKDSKNPGILHEVVGLIELEDGTVIQVSTNRFTFLDPKAFSDTCVGCDAS